MSDDKTPVEQALDLFVYAPIGLLFEGRTVFDQLVEKGRSQAAMAKTIGQFAVQQGQTEATKVAGRLSDQAIGLLDVLGVGPHSNGASAGAPPASAGPSAASPPATTVEPTAPQPAEAGPPVESLAIPDYDGLSASQVVNRLGGLVPAELRAVLDYESAHRARKTILNKASQLLG